MRGLSGIRTWTAFAKNRCQPVAESEYLCDRGASSFVGNSQHLLPEVNVRRHHVIKIVDHAPNLVVYWSTGFFLVLVNHGYITTILMSNSISPITQFRLVSGLPGCKHMFVTIKVRRIEYDV